LNDFKVACQEALVDFLDFTKRKFEKVEWEDLYSIVKGQVGVKALPENYFAPHTDKTIPSTKIARIRQFVVKDLDGNVLFDNSNSDIPYYYGENYSNVFDQINNLI